MDFGFIDESGVLDESVSKQPYFGVGFLRLADTSLIGERLTQKHYDYFSVQREGRKKLFQELKNNPRMLGEKELSMLFRSTRHHEYKFGDINYGNVEKYKQLVDTAFEFPLYFCALVIDKTDPLFDSTIYKNYWNAYIKYTQLLCKYNCAKEGSLCVVADYMSKPKNSTRFFEVELNRLPNVLNTLRAHSETFMFIQVCDLLLGSTIFQWKQNKGVITNSRNARAKIDFVSHLLDKLRIPSIKKITYPLAQKITLNEPIYFSVWPLKLSDTKSGDVRTPDSPPF